MTHISPAIPRSHAFPTKTVVGAFFLALYVALIFAPSPAPAINAASYEDAMTFKVQP